MLNIVLAEDIDGVIKESSAAKDKETNGRSLCL